MTLEAHGLTQPAEGHTEGGDTFAICRVPEGALSMVAVVDVLGHGLAAARVARVAHEYLHSLSTTPAVVDLLQELDRVLHGTRGAAALACVFEGTRFEACGVGNVDLRTFGFKVPVRLSPGILGGRVRRYLRFAGELVPGSALVIHSDGISSRFSPSDVAGLGVREACETLMQKYRRAHDDSTVLVVGAQYGCST